MEQIQDKKRSKGYLLISFDALKEQERSGVLGYDAMLQDDDINDKMHLILVDWLYAVAKEFDLSRTTQCATVNILDAYICRVPVNRDNFQLVGISAMSIAAKYNEVNPPDISDYVYMCSGKCDEVQIRDTEGEIFIHLGCNVNVPIDIEYYFAHFQIDKSNKIDSLNLTSNIILTFMYSMPNYLPSVIISASRHIAAAIYDEHDVDVFQIPFDVIISCINAIISFFDKLSKLNLTAYKELGHKLHLEQ